MTRWTDILSRHLWTVSRLASLQDRFFYCYGRILRRSKLKMPGRHATVRICLREEVVPFHLRLDSTDWLVLEEIYLKGEYSAVNKFVKGVRTVVDLGANVGFSLRYWQKAFPQARIIALEPDAGNCRVCRKNIDAAQIGNRVILLEAAVGPQRARGILVDGQGEWAYRTENPPPGETPTIDILSLAEVLDRYAGGGRIDLLKCDIEGAERGLFRECKSWINRVDAIAIELHPPYTLKELTADLDRAGADFGVVDILRDKTYPLLLLRRKQV